MVVSMLVWFFVSCLMLRDKTQQKPGGMITKEDSWNSADKTGKKCSMAGGISGGWDQSNT